MDRATDKWTDEEVKALLAIYASEEIQRGFEGSKRNIKIFATISCQFSPYFLRVLFCSVVECGAKVTRLSQTVVSHQSLPRSLTHVRMQNDLFPWGRAVYRTKLRWTVLRTAFFQRLCPNAAIITLIF